MQKTNQKELRIEKVIKRKGDKLYVKWKGYDNSFNSGVDIKDIMSGQYFPPYRGHIADVRVRLDLTKYAIKTDLKNVTHVDTSIFALKNNLSSLKTEVDKLDIDKLVPIPNDLEINK